MRPGFGYSPFPSQSCNPFSPSYLSRTSCSSNYSSSLFSTSTSSPHHPVSTDDSTVVPKLTATNTPPKRPMPPSTPSASISTPSVVDSPPTKKGPTRPSLPASPSTRPPLPTSPYKPSVDRSDNNQTSAETTKVGDTNANDTDISHDTSHDVSWTTGFNKSMMALSDTVNTASYPNACSASLLEPQNPTGKGRRCFCSLHLRFFCIHKTIFFVCINIFYA